jgi:hypothetical protein
MMAIPYKQPSFWEYTKHLWKREAIFRWLVSFVLVVGAIVMGFEIFEAVVIYDDWRCLFTECRIVKAGESCAPRRSAC